MNGEDSSCEGIPPDTVAKATHSDRTVPFGLPFQEAQPAPLLRQRGKAHKCGNPCVRRSILQTLRVDEGTLFSLLS